MSHDLHPRGEDVTEDERLWEKFCRDFDAAFFKCADTGEQRRIRASVGGRTVVVDIYPAGATMKKFDEMILGAVKQQTGIDLVKKP
jgi:hypothetical protein